MAGAKGGFGQQPGQFMNTPQFSFNRAPQMPTPQPAPQPAPPQGPQGAFALAQQNKQSPGVAEWRQDMLADIPQYQKQRVLRGDPVSLNGQQINAIRAAHPYVAQQGMQQPQPQRPTMPAKGGYGQQVPGMFMGGF